MSRTRPRHAPVLLASSLLFALTVAPAAEAACNATCRRDIARCMATQCAGAGREACRRRCKPAAIRTLAYVMTECRVDAAGMEVGRQALRIRRGDREAITVVEFGPSEPIPDPQGLCRGYGTLRFGPNAMVAGPLQRLGVTPDGSGVVFEVNDGFSIFNPPTLLPEQKGFFFVPSDGHEPARRLGPPSRDPAFRTVSDPAGQAPFLVRVQQPSAAFSPNGRRIAFTDLGPGPGGEEAVQIVVLDLEDPTKRTYVTRLPSGVGSFFTVLVSFIDNETVLFYTLTNPDGLDPEHNGEAFSVRIDGSGLKKISITLPSTAGGQVISIFGVTHLATHLLSLSVPGTPENPLAGADFPIAEVFVVLGNKYDQFLQLTAFGRIDTGSLFLNGTHTRVFFRASANPLHNKNRYGGCQIFSIGTLGSGLRQLTHFAERPGDPATTDACWNTIAPSCSVGAALAAQDPVTKAVVFESSCDPLGANPDGSQIFAMRPDGEGLRQLTDAAEFMTNPDGSIRVELPGPVAYSVPVTF